MAATPALPYHRRAGITLFSGDDSLGRPGAVGDQPPVGQSSAGEAFSLGNEPRFVRDRPDPEAGPKAHAALAAGGGSVSGGRSVQNALPPFRASGHR